MEKFSCDSQPGWYGKVGGSYFPLSKIVLVGQAWININKTSTA
jgi:hypothetical protein